MCFRTLLFKKKVRVIHAHDIAEVILCFRILFFKEVAVIHAQKSTLFYFCASFQKATTSDFRFSGS